MLLAVLAWADALPPAERLGKAGDLYVAQSSCDVFDGHAGGDEQFLGQVLADLGEQGPVEGSRQPGPGPPPGRQIPALCQGQGSRVLVGLGQWHVQHGRVDADDGLLGVETGDDSEDPLVGSGAAVRGREGEGHLPERNVGSTGEIGFVRDLRERQHDRARATGAVMLPAFGYDYVPGILAGAPAARQAGKYVRALDIGYFVAGSLRGGRGLSEGTRKTVADGITRPVTVWQNGRPADERVGRSVRSFTVRGRRRQAALA